MGFEKIVFFFAKNDSFELFCIFGMKKAFANSKKEFFVISSASSFCICEKKAKQIHSKFQLSLP